MGEPKWIDEDQSRYRSINWKERHDRVCIKLKDGVHFIPTRDEQGYLSVEEKTVCGIPVRKDEYTQTPIAGIVDCPDCLTAMENALKESSQ